MEISKLWYARSRLSYCVFGLLAWFDPALHIRPKWILLVTRVMEKPQELTVACLDRCLELLEKVVEQCERASLWCDPGPHNRGYKVLGTRGLGYCERLRKAVAVNFGLQDHFKNPCDGLYGELNEATTDASTRRIIKTIPQLVDVWREYFEYRRASHENHSGFSMPEVIIEEWMPPAKHVVANSMIDFDAGSLPVGIQGCHTWEFWINDARRKPKNTSVWHDTDTLRAQYISCKAAMFPGAKCHEWQTVRPYKLKEKTVHGCEEGPLATADGFPESETMFRDGWRLSYRSVQPENHDKDTYAAKLARKLEAYSHCLKQLGEGKRGKSKEEQQAAAQARADKGRTIKKKPVALVDFG